MKWKIACAVIAAIAIGEGIVIAKDLIDDVEEPPVATLPTDPLETSVPPERQLELARRFRPILRFDTKEAWRPLEIDRFLEETHAGREYVHRLCDRAIPPPDPPACKSVGGIARFRFAIAGLAQHGVNHYLDIAGTKANGLDFRTPDRGCGATPPLLDCNDGSRTAIYYNVREANGRFYVDYWWFYRYNDFPEFDAAQRCERSFRPLCGDHEGDWEGITVVTSAADPDEVEYVSYAAHNGTNRYAAPQLGLDEAGETRPPVYVADGSHASYPDTCFGELPVVGCQQLAGKANRGLPEGDHDGARAWGRNEGPSCDDDPEARGNTECLQPLPPASEEREWNAYTGLWGRVCVGASACPVVRGPQSPGRQPRYREPWCALAVAADGKTVSEKRSCDVVTAGTGPEGDPGVASDADCAAWAGASTSVLACDREALADALASEEGDEQQTITVRIRGEDVGQTKTRGVAQVVGKPIRARANVLIAGRVSDVQIRARQPDGLRPKDLVEATFSGVGLRAGEEAKARIRYRGGEVRVTLLLPSGEVLQPTEPEVRPLQAPAPTAQP